jgi:hypothetical protein
MTLPRDLASRTHTFTFQETDWVAVLRVMTLLATNLFGFEMMDCAL